MSQRYPTASNPRLGDRHWQRGQPLSQPQTPPYARNPVDLQGPARSKVFIENVPISVDEAALRKRFQVFGALDSLTLLINSEPNVPRLGICNYVHDDDAYAAFQGMNRKIFEGSVLRVILANSTESYEEAKARFTADTPRSEDTISSEYLENISSGNDAQRSQICDHQDTTTGHICGEPFLTSQALIFESSRKDDMQAHMEDIHGIMSSILGPNMSHQQDARRRPNQVQRRPAPDTRTKRTTPLRHDEKLNLGERYHSAEEEKAEIVRRYVGDTTVDYRPFKCQVRGCKFLKEGFETQSELVAHEDKEHDGQRGMSAISITTDIPTEDKPALTRSQLPRHQPSKKGKEIMREPPLESALIVPSSAPSLSDAYGEVPQNQKGSGSDSATISDTLPRYSVIITQPSPFYSPDFLSGSVPTEVAAPEPPLAAPETGPADKPATPLTQSEAGRPSNPRSSPASTVKQNYTPHDGRNLRYRYNSDGSRYVTGAVVLSPDKHRVLVLRSNDESKKIRYQLPSGFLELNDQNMEASALRECWQNAGIVGRILRAIEPAPAEEPDENGLADWHSYFEIEVEKEKDRWPKHQIWHRRWLNYREARVFLSSQPDSIRALERSTIFKRGSSSLSKDDASENRLVPHSVIAPPPLKTAKVVEGARPRRRQHFDERPPTTRKYSTVSPATDNIAAWRRDILPWLRRNFSTVMGKNKHGAIELLRVRNKPTICITCSDPKELELDTFAEVVSDLFPMHVKVGLLARSSGDKSKSQPRSLDSARSCQENMEEEERLFDSDSHEHDTSETDNVSSGSYTRESIEDSQPPGKGTTSNPKPEKAFRSPPIFGKYVNRPSCGATIGTVQDDDSSISAGTFGGVVILVKEDGTEAPYGLISHHVIEEKTEDTELGTGVDEGWLINSSGAHRFPVQQPARMDLEEAKDSLDMQRYYCDREKRYCDVDDGRAVRAKLAVLDGLDQQAVDFGHVAYSSGYGFDANRHQMDWALIGDIPSWRLEDNIVPGVDSFYDLHYDGSPKAPYPVEKTFFSFLSETFEQEHSVDLSEIDPLRRIHGVGSYSGLMDGIVSSETAFFRLDGMDSEEWFFTPRYNGGLGVKGDSGTWIFDDFGKVVGQIIAYNYRTDTAYFTRMDYLFEHIKSKTKAVEVYIPYKGELSKWKTDEMPKQLESMRSGSVTDGSSSYVDSAFGTTKTSDTDITSPLTISDSGLGWTGFRNQT
ncbi:hypothetical protein ABW19_dt0201169 [Dactylella cylindrospora]|nr:hypothetical protein ABW19_dt0201169 [Dactylella cylindrospora]